MASLGDADCVEARWRPHQRDRRLGFPDDLLGGVAEHDASECAPPLGRHRDRIGAEGFGFAEDLRDRIAEPHHVTDLSLVVPGQSGVRYVWKSEAATSMPILNLNDSRMFGKSMGRNPWRT